MIPVASLDVAQIPHGYGLTVVNSLAMMIK